MIHDFYGKAFWSSHLIYTTLFVFVTSINRHPTDIPDYHEHMNKSFAKLSCVYIWKWLDFFVVVSIQWLSTTIYAVVLWADAVLLLLELCIARISDVNDILWHLTSISMEHNPTRNREWLPDYKFKLGSRNPHTSIPLWIMFITS